MRLLRWFLLGALATAFNLPAQELLRNGRFDQPGPYSIAHDWRPTALGTNVAAAFEHTDASPGGPSVQRIIVTAVPSFRWVGLLQEIPELAGGLYEFHVRLRAEQPVLVGVEVRLRRNPQMVLGRRRVVAKPGGWTELRGFASLTGAETNVDFIVQLHNPGTVELAEAGLQRVDRNALNAEERKRYERQFGPELPPVDAARVLAETDERIRRNRTGPMTVKVLDAQCRPATNRVVRLEHLRHLFWLGTMAGPPLPRWNETVAERRLREDCQKIFNGVTVLVDWGGYEPQPGHTKHRATLRAVRGLEKLGFQVRGNFLFWNPPSTLPAWLQNLDPEPAALEKLCDRRLQQLARTVLPHFQDIGAFNELVNWEHITNAFTRLLVERGKVETAARYMRELKRLAPDCRVGSNDYDVSPEYYELLHDLLDAGAPLEIIGQQAHMHSGYWPVEQTWTVLERLGRLQRPVLFTEVSVLSGPIRSVQSGQPLPENWETDPAHEQAQADFLEQFYRLLYSHPNCAGIVLWNYSDTSAWLGAPVGIFRKDGSRKPSFDRLDQLINHQWRTRGEFRTDSRGEVRIPAAYEGHYAIRCGKKSFELDHSAKAPLSLEFVE